MKIEKVYSTRIVADKLGVSQMTVQRLVLNNRLPSPDYYFQYGEHKVKLWKPETIEKFQDQERRDRQG